MLQAVSGLESCYHLVSMSEMVSNVAGGKKLPPDVHKFIMKTSNELRDKLEKALRLKDKTSKFEKMIAE